jgi:nicotinamide-nucleotide amidase
MQVAILAIGTELLIGQTINTNAAWMGERLTKLGVTITESLAIADDKDLIISSIDRLSADADYLFITGGLGPTKDDITKNAIASYLNVGMYFDEPTYQKIVDFFTAMNLSLSHLHKEQCYFPVGTKLLTNNMGTAPGMLFETPNCNIISMPGVPYEMQSIFTESVTPLLEQDDRRVPYYQQTIRTAGIAESKLADRIEAIIDNMPKNLDVAYLPSLGSVKVRISGSGLDAKSQVEQIIPELVEVLNPYVYGFNDMTIAEAVQHEMIDQGLTLGIAESCTGGYIGHLITSTPGSSKYYQGGVLAYSNAIKMNLLKVKEATLQDHGAVSEATVREMVIGCTELLNVDVAIAVSGIAGPGGGTETKPVGTIWIAVGNAETQLIKKFNLKKNRLINIRYSSNAALIMLRKFLMAD